MPHLIRGAVLNNYVEVARSVGLDPYRMVAACNLPATCLTDAEAKVPAIAVARLLEASAGQSGRPDFGLLLAERRTLSNLGALALLVREQPTIRKALEALVAAGLASIDDTDAVYLPASRSVQECIEAVERLYHKRANAVRRAIISASTRRDSEFAAAFKVRRDRDD